MASYSDVRSHPTTNVVWSAFPALVAFLIAACGGDHETTDAPPVPDAPPQIDAGPPDAAPDVYADVYAAVDQDRLMTTLRELTGYDPVTVGGETFSINERFSDAG